MSKWIILSQKNTNSSNYSEWEIDCPNPDCNGYVYPAGNINPESYTCDFCNEKVEFAVKIVDN